MKWGTAMEAHARADYEMDSGNDTIDAPFIAYDCWLGASPDALIGNDGVLEIKAPFSIRNDNPPTFKPLAEQEYYKVQCQIEMFVSDRSWLDFYQWTPFGQKLERLDRDNDWLNANLPVLKQFWSEYVDTVNDPEACAEHLAPLRITIDTPTALLMVQEYDQLTEAIDNATERRKDLLAEMVALAGEKNALISGRKLTLTRKAGAVSYKSALDHYAPGANVAAFRGKASESWGLK